MLQITVPVRYDENGVRSPDYDGPWAQPIYHKDGTVTITVPQDAIPPNALRLADLYGRISPAEYAAIEDDTTPEIRHTRALWSARGYATAEEVEALEAAGLLEPGRADEILEP